MTNFIMSDQMKLVFVLHNQQGQSLGDKHLKKKFEIYLMIQNVLFDQEQDPIF